MNQKWVEDICIPLLHTIYTSTLTSDSSYQIPFSLSLISKLLCEMLQSILGETASMTIILLGSYLKLLLLNNFHKNRRVFGAVLLK